MPDIFDRVRAPAPPTSSASRSSSTGRSLVPYYGGDPAVRPMPALPMPPRGDSLFSHGRALRAIRDTNDLTGLADAAKRFFDAAGSLEASRQAAEVIFERRRLLPQLVRREELLILAEVARAESDLDAARCARDEARTYEEQRREQETKNHRIEVLQRDLAELELTAEIRKRRDAMGAQKSEAPADNAPEAFRRHYQTSQEVLRNRSEAQRRINEIYLRAAAERRPLSDADTEEIDAIADADSAAEADVRRGAASDLP